MSRTYGIYLKEFIKFIESLPCPKCEERRKKRIIENLKKYQSRFNKSPYFCLTYTKMKKLDTECLRLINLVGG